MVSPFNPFYLFVFSFSFLLYLLLLLISFFYDLQDFFFDDETGEVIKNPDPKGGLWIVCPSPFLSFRVLYSVSSSFLSCLWLIFSFESYICY